MALAEPIKTRADFGNFAGNSDYGGGTSGGSHGGGGFISDLETEALSWVIAIALVIIMIIYYALIKPIIDKIRGKNPEDEDEETDEVLRMRELRGGSPDGQKLRPIKEYGELDPGFQESAFCERLSNLYVQLQDAWQYRRRRERSHFMLISGRVIKPFLHRQTSLLWSQAFDP